MAKPLLNILTRTCDRPNHFRRHRESLLAQEWGGTIRHIVSIDRPCSYAGEADILVPALGRISPPVPSAQQKYRLAPYNLYVNDLLEAVGDGWIMVLDDDDELFAPDALAALEPHMRDAGNLFICKFLLGKNVMPKAFGRKLVLNDVPCSSIIYHSRHKKYGQWHGKYSGDFNAAYNLSQRLKPVWVDKVIAGTQDRPNQGVMRERGYIAWKPREIPPANPEVGLLSIIIPVLNQAQYTAAIIENIRETVHIPYEIIVIDNGSTDETPEILEGLTVIRNERNVGMSRSWNQGCKAAKGSHLAIINNDLILPDMWAEKLLEYGEHAICPSYKQGERIRPNFEAHNKMLGRRPSRTKVADRPGNHPNGFAGFCFTISREAYDQVGPFDEQFFYWYGDNDYYIRLLDMGYEPLQSLNVEIHHYHSKTSKELPDFYSRREQDCILFDRKWPSAI